MGLLNKIKDFFHHDREEIHVISETSFESWKGVKTSALYGNEDGYTCHIKKGYGDTIENIVLYPPEGKGESINLPNKKSVERKILNGEPMSKLYTEYKQQKSKRWLKDTRKDHKEFLDAQSKISESIEKMKTATPKEKEQLNLLMSKLKKVVSIKRDEIDGHYHEVSPQLARLRKEEAAKVAKGIDPKQAQKERREAVKAYYKEKGTKEI